MREKIEKDCAENGSMKDENRNVEELLADEETTQDELQELKAWQIGRASCRERV